MIDSITSISSKIVAGQNSYFYVDYVSANDLRKLSEHRDLKISNIVGDLSDEDFKSSLDVIPSLKLDRGDSYVDEVSLRLVSISATSSYYNSNDHLNSTILDHIVNCTNMKHPDSSVRDLVLNTNSTLTNMSTFSRQVTTRLIMMSNMVAINGRRGPGTSVFVGLNVVDYLEDAGGFSSNVYGKHPNSIGTIGGLNIIAHDKIPSNKIIVLRKDVDFTKGINLSYDKNNNMYCLFNIGNWWESVYWFNII